MKGENNFPQLALGSWAFSFGPFADNPWSFDRVCRFAAEAGYSGIEINGFRPHPHHRDYENDGNLSSLKLLMADAGVTPVTYAPDLAHFPPGEVDESVYLSEIDLARKFCEGLDVHLLRVDTGSAPSPLPRPAYEARFDRLVKTWTAASERCAQSDITLLWEFEPGFWLNRPSEVRKLVEAVNHPSFGILFDSSHAYTCAVAGARQGTEPEVLPGGEIEYAQMLQPYVRHVHLIDSDGSLHDEETSAHLPFGTGKVDFLGMLRALRPTLDSLAWWGVDFCFWPMTEVDAPKAVPFLRSLAGDLYAATP